jgi:APA family basic amino acid/polyamine antiporter
VLIVLRYRMPAHPRPFRAPLSIGKLPVLPVLALVSIVLLLVHFEWKIYLAGAAAVALSALAYALRQWMRRR